MHLPRWKETLGAGVLLLAVSLPAISAEPAGRARLSDRRPAVKRIQPAAHQQSDLVPVPDAAPPAAPPAEPAASAPASAAPMMSGGMVGPDCPNGGYGGYGSYGYYGSKYGPSQWATRGYTGHWKHHECYRDGGDPTRGYRYFGYYPPEPKDEKIAWLQYQEGLHYEKNRRTSIALGAHLRCGLRFLQPLTYWDVGCQKDNIALDPHYSDPRDHQAYAAQGYGVPITVPVAPVVHQYYNYSWGMPASRLTPQ